MRDLFDLRAIKPNVRKLSGMREVIYDREWLKKTSNIELYYMYRDLALTDNDRNAMKEKNLRYDITVIPPLNLGKEFVKTAGHYHPLVPGTKLSYPEVYEVLDGRAHYLLQKVEGNRVLDVVLIDAKKRDKVLIPPDYGHITINPSNETLKMANWISDAFESVYEPIEKMHGGAYFELTNGKFVKNTAYKKIPELRKIKPAEVPEFGLLKNKNMYGLVGNLEKLDFLNNPQSYKKIFEQVYA